ncbi:hypothetical protein OXPF_12240 [Oxobacter pfennigii]|uniref:Knr4/Smi1-like domain-containing protein n=1 Tax=Oxobacter pfennigii TaxID=36849 RepID=A0A0P8YZM2_9CLOT|nr:SMI1/KNR4 family protein [Oxobacter pfennigii]KPU45331.1 hypothetical protein OXPF_12240 [Oxobacter pfennigii]
MRYRFEKFERKYNFQLPDSYRLLVTELGDGYAVGNCEFFPTSDFIDNNLRLGGAMEVGLFPFGGLGNGDCFCFLKYGENPDEYYIALWLHETYNYVILNSTFDNFIYNCVIQEYKALLYPQEYMAEGTREEYEECIEKINSVSSLMDFDISAIEKAKNEEDLNELIIKRDPYAVQLLCMRARKILEVGNIAGEKYLNRAMYFSPNYTAPYYIMGKYLLNKDKKEGINLLFKAAQTPVAASGYSYWDEDDAGIPKSVLEEIFNIILENESLLSEEQKKSPFMDFIRQQRPYDSSFRFVLVEKYIRDGNYMDSIKELNNVLVLTGDYKLKIKILEMLIPLYEKAGLVWASGICRRDIKYLKGLK